MVGYQICLGMLVQVLLFMVKGWFARWPPQRLLIHNNVVWQAEVPLQSAMFALGGVVDVDGMSLVSRSNCVMSHMGVCALHRVEAPWHSSALF